LVPENATVRYEFCSSSNTASQQSSWESDHQDFKNLCGAVEGLGGTETSGQVGIGVLTSGEVVVLDELDRELKPFYRLAVVVKTR
uniref:Kinesin motor domain-containing protein n=1 Tax=Anisakis simplex TaxID=6269 RepID=A0A0M3JKY1_ANISI